MNILTRLKFINKDTDKYCYLIVKISNLETNNKCYKINIEYDFENKDIPTYLHPDNPFISLNYKQYNYHINNFLVTKNELSDKLIEFFLLDSTELSNLTGTITPLKYKLGILISLQNFIEY